MEEILIKKYDNRRLYCVNTAKYVSLGDIRDMIAAGKNVKVVEKTSGDDITKYILVQVLLEERYKVLPEFFLKMLIQSPAAVLEQFFQGFFPQMFEYFLRLRENQMAGMSFQNMMFPQQGFSFNPFQNMPQNIGNPAAQMDELLKRIADLEKKLK